MNENPIPVLTSPCVPARVHQGVSVDQRHLHKTNLTIKEYIWKKVNIPSILIIVFSGRKPRNYQCEFHCLLFLFIFQIYYINFSFTCYIHVTCNCICIVFIRVNSVRRKVVHSTHFCWSIWVRAVVSILSTVLAYFTVNGNCIMHNIYEISNLSLCRLQDLSLVGCHWLWCCSFDRLNCMIYLFYEHPH